MSAQNSADKICHPELVEGLRAHYARVAPLLHAAFGGMPVVSASFPQGLARKPIGTPNRCRLSHRCSRGASTNCNRSSSIRGSQHPAHTIAVASRASS